VSEFLAALGGGIVGALGTYLLGLFDKRRDEQRRREAVASALLAECDWIASSLIQLRDHWNVRSRTTAAFSTTVHDRFAEHISLFDPSVVQAVFEFIGTVNDVREGIRAQQSILPSMPEFDGVKAQIQSRADAALARIPKARELLEGAGGRLPLPMGLPANDKVEALVRDVRTRWGGQIE
jgi:hypothetical protein